MASLHALTKARLIKLLEDTIAGYGDARFTIKQLANKALPEARKICEGDLDAAICGWLKPLAKRLLTKEPESCAVPLPLEISGLPYRIAVPSPHRASEDCEDDDGDEDSGITWPPLHLASIAEVARNLAMRKDLIDKSQTEHDRIKLVLDEARARTSDENAIIGDVFAAKKK